MHLSQMRLRPLYIQRAVRRITLPGNRNSGRGNINCTVQTRRCFLNYTHKLNAQGKFVTLSIRNEVVDISHLYRASSLEFRHIQFSSLVFYVKMSCVRPPRVLKVVDETYQGWDTARYKNIKVEYIDCKELAPVGNIIIIRNRKKGACDSMRTSRAAGRNVRYVRCVLLAVSVSVFLAYCYFGISRTACVCVKTMCVQGRLVPWKIRRRQSFITKQTLRRNDEKRLHN